MNVTVVHQQTEAGGPPDEQDVLEQVEAVAAALQVLGHTCRILPCSLDLEGFRSELIRKPPDAVFNLVESLDGSCRLLPLLPALLDHMGIPYTGSNAYALWVTTQKVLAKKALSEAGIPTPEWIGPVPEDPAQSYGSRDRRRTPPDRWIVKSLWEHASFGLDDACLVTGSEKTVRGCLRSRSKALGGACFAEAYVEGREFNLSLLDGPAGPQVLPPAEILFSEFGSHRLPIVGYRAKWETDSFEYHHTPRRFVFPDQDGPLLERLCDVALRCWRLFGLQGYARVDFRVDLDGREWVLEINANPCISPDAGFAAALAAAQIPFTRAVQQILSAAVRVPSAMGSKRQTTAFRPSIAPEPPAVFLQ